MNSDAVPVIGPEWEIYSYTYGDGLLARIHFDAREACAKKHRGYKSCIRVILFIPPERILSNGMPASDDELASLLTHQRHLTDQLSGQNISCRFVGSMLYGGMHDLVFQVEPKEADKFESVVSDWLQADMPYKVQIKKSKGWNFFQEKLMPDPSQAQQISDRKTIQALIEAGTDVSKPHLLNHTILGSPGVLRNIASDLETGGFINPHFPEKKVLQISSESMLDLMQVWATTGKLVSYCSEWKATYDGWEAQVIRPD